MRYRMAVGIVTNNKVTFQKYYGTENLESDKKVDQNSMFRVYSSTKLMSNVGLFQLVEQGKLSVEDKISKYVDNIPAEWQNVKVKIFFPTLQDFRTGLISMILQQMLPTLKLLTAYQKKKWNLKPEVITDIIRLTTC